MTTLGNILITGGSGNLGTEIIKLLLCNESIDIVHNIDLQPSILIDDRIQNHLIDIRSKKVAEIIRTEKIDIIIHLVAIIGHSNISAEEVRDIEISGLTNILNASIKHEIKQLIFTSSGSVYGYHPKLPSKIPETTQLFDKHVIQYGRNKVDAEKIIMQYQSEFQLKATVFRICSILGENADNLISRWFRRKRIIGLKGFSSPFSFIWDEDVAHCIVEAINRKILGTYNLSGSGTITLKEIAKIQSKKYIEINEKLLGRTIGLLNKIALTEYKKEHLNFMKYRPILDVSKFEKTFTHAIKKNSQQALFDFLSKSTS